MKRRGFAFALALAAMLAAAARTDLHAQEGTKLGTADLSAVMTHYVDSSVETRQFIAACAAGKRPGWDEGAAMLVASLRAAGLGTVEEVKRRLEENDSGPAYDCSDASSKLRLEALMPGDWSEIHRRLLQAAGIREVAGNIDADPKVAAIRAAIAAHVEPQADMLNCMSLIQAEFLAFAWVDWNDALDRAMAMITRAGYPEDLARSATEAARSGKLIRPVGDRQAEIAKCAADDAWITRYATFTPYTVVSDVEAAVGAKN